MTRLFEDRPFIVAEVGSNWASLRDCIESIGIAKAVGASAVKFQAFTAEALYGWDHEQERVDKARAETRGYLDVHPSHYAVRNSSLPLDWLPALKNKADACGIELMCTAFSPELVAAVDPFVSVHKVASSDLAYPQLLKAVAKTGKPVLLSTGASSERDIEQALTYFNYKRYPDPGVEPSRVVLLYCVAAYPARFVDFTVLRLMDQLAPDLRCGFGFSDHTLGITASVEAARQGAQVIEKHFTAFPDLDTPDRPHSLTADEFKLMVDHIRGVRTPVIGPTPEERAMLLRHNRRLVATQDISVGTVLKYGENYGAYRSLEDDDQGYSPFLWEQVEGKQALTPLQRGKGLGPKTVRIA